MAIFKTYDGVPIEDIDHDHKVEDTQATRKLIAAGATELFSTSTAALTYYSTTLTPVIETEVVGSRDIMIFSVNSSDINGNLVLKMSTSTPLVSSKEYILVLEPIEDTNAKTNIISMNFGAIAPYNFKNAVFISEDIVRPIINYGTKITYMYKIRPQQDINSIIVYLYTITKVTGTNKKQLFKISLREAEYQEQMSTAIVTKEETGFMSAEDKNKLEKINTLSNYIESKLVNAVFYAKIEPPKIATLLSGQEFNTKLKSIGPNATSVVFTNTSIPSDKVSSAEVISADSSRYKAYMYLDGETLYVSPEEDDIPIYANEDCSNMFNGCSLSYFDVSKLDTSKVTNMSGMFGGTGSNTSYRIVGLNSWNTSKVTNMSGMFAYCGILSSEWNIGDLSNWNTSNVTDMSRLFKSACESSPEFNIGDLSNWNTSNVTDMHNLFEGTGYSATIFNIGDLGNWNTSKVTDMSYMFNNCPAVSSSITIMNTKTISYSNMFTNCSTAEGTEFIVNYIDDATKNVATQMVATKSDNSHVYLYGIEQAFAVYSADDQSLNFYKRYDVPSVGDTFESKTVTNVFTGIENTEMIIPWLDILSQVQTIDIIDDNIKPNSTCNWFYGAIYATHIDVSKLDTSNVTNMSSMFEKTGQLSDSIEIIGLDNFDTSKVTDMSNIFYLSGSKSTNWSIGDISSWNTSNVEYMTGMFSSSGGSDENWYVGDLSKWDLSNKDMSNMFLNCPYANTTITINSTSIYDYSNMFLKSATKEGSLIVVKYVDDETKALAEQMVATKSDNSHVYLYGSEQAFAVYSANDQSLNFYKRYDVPSVGDTFESKTVTNVFTGIEDNNITYISNYSDNINTLFWAPDVENSSSPFYSIAEFITHVNIIDRIKPIDMTGWFHAFHNLMEADLSLLDTSNVTSMSSLFRQCTDLLTVNFGNFNFTNVTDVSSMFYNCHNLTSSITINSTNITSYSDMFYMCSTVDNSEFIVNYTYNETKALAEQMVATKSSNSNVYLDGTQQAFAVYSATDKSLNFYKRFKVPSVGSTFEGKAVTYVYTGIETSYYASSPGQVPWGSVKFTTVNVVDEIMPLATARWFYAKGCSSMNLDKLNLSKTEHIEYMFTGAQVNTSFTIRSANITTDSSIFWNTSTEEGCQITINYIDDATKAYAERLVSFGKNSNSNVVLGTLVS